MAGTDNDIEEPQADGPEAEGDDPAQPKGRRRSFGKVRRELSEDELGSPGVQKMMLADLERLDEAESDLKSVSAKYNITIADLAVAKEKLKTHNAFDVIATGTIAFGTLIIGFTSNIEGNDKIKIVFYIFGAALIIVGIVAKVMRA
jgi:hypothetical protein